MSNEVFRVVRGRQAGMVLECGTLTIGAAGAITASDAFGFSVVRVSAGLFRITLNQKAKKLAICNARLQSTTTGDKGHFILLADATNTTGIIDLQHCNLTAGTAADPGNGDKVLIQLVLVNSGVK